MEKLLAHLAHLEITSPDVATSVAFYTEKFGMRVVDEVDGTAYLRCWGDYYRYSLVVSQGDEPSLKRMAWRTLSDDALDEAASRVEAKGVEVEWRSDLPGVGRAFDFVGPFGHRMSLFSEVEAFQADEEHRSWSLDRPEKRSSHAGAPRFLDHVTVCAKDVEAFCEWYRDLLGFRIMAYTQLDEVPLTIFGVLTTNEKSHDLGVVADASNRGGRVNHIAFWVDTHEELLISADVLMEQGVAMEYGPGIHGIGEQNYLYFREPSDMRVELNSGGYRNYVPSWEPKVWKPATGSANIYRNVHFPESMTVSFPPAEAGSATEEGVPSDELKEQIISAYHAG